MLRILKKYQEVYYGILSFLSLGLCFEMLEEAPVWKVWGDACGSTEAPATDSRPFRNEGSYLRGLISL
jgi:hypothetical protein